MATSRVIIRTLLDFGRRAPASPAASAAFNTVQATLVPYFYTVIGSKKGVKKIHGPFLQMPADVQRRSLDMISYFAAPSLAMLRAVAS